jgi:hypothetical protein
MKPVLLQSKGKRADGFIKAIPTWTTNAQFEVCRLQNNMEAACNLYLSFWLMEITSKSLDACEIVHVYKRCMRNSSHTKNDVRKLMIITKLFNAI